MASNLPEEISITKDWNLKCIASTEIKYPPDEAPSSKQGEEGDRDSTKRGPATETARQRQRERGDGTSTEFAPQNNQSGCTVEETLEPHPERQQWLHLGDHDSNFLSWTRAREMESGDSPADWDPVGAQEYATLFTAIFGESDTDEDSQDQHCADEKVDNESDEELFWDKVGEVDGLWHCSNFLSIKQQQSLLEAIESEGWFSDPLHNQAMRFGDLPGWAKDLSSLIQRRSGGQSCVEGLEQQTFDQSSESDGPDGFRHATSPFPSPILEREPFFDQMIVNIYQPGEVSLMHAAGGFSDNTTGQSIQITKSYL